MSIHETLELLSKFPNGTTYDNPSFLKTKQLRKRKLIELIGIKKQKEGRGSKKNVLKITKDGLDYLHYLDKNLIKI